MPLAFLPLKASGSSFLEINSQYVLSRQESPYYLSGIKVLPEGELRLEPGVRIIFSKNAEFLVEGVLLAEGTEESFIKLGGSFGQFWTGLKVKSPGSRLKYVEFSGFYEPIELSVWEPDLAYLKFNKGNSNILKLNSPELLPKITIHHLEFLGGYSLPVGMVLTGAYGTVTVESLLFDTPVAGLTESELPGIRILGNYRAGSFSRISFADGCLQKPVLKSSQEFYLLPDLGRCQINRYPVIFVPGFGASINLRYLTKLPKESVSQEGWQFFKSLTPAYFDWLDRLKANHIPYKIAYYDWRLPAEKAAELYLKPVIEEAKAEFHSPKVNLIAHSFGGIVSRAYIQGLAYTQDVDWLVELGSPNWGAVKAYGVWQAAELPSDWQAVGHLLRFYAYMDALSKPTSLASNLEIVHQYFPSVRDLLPVYPAIFQSGQAVFLEEMHWPNLWLNSLNQAWEKTAALPKVLLVGSKSESTLARLQVEKYDRGNYWLDGKPSATQPDSWAAGDGTVPWQSLVLPRAETWEILGTHAELPLVAADQVIRKLYPGQFYQVPSSPAKKISGYLNFLFDCPVQAEITTPEKKKITYPAGLSEKSFTYDMDGSEEMIWISAPRQAGDYLVRITALAKTTVRSWVEQESIQVVELNSGETVTYKYRLSEKEARPRIVREDEPPAIPSSSVARLEKTSVPEVSKAYLPEASPVPINKKVLLGRVGIDGSSDHSISFANLSLWGEDSMRRIVLANLPWGKLKGFAAMPPKQYDPPGYASSPQSKNKVAVPIYKPGYARIGFCLGLFCLLFIFFILALRKRKQEKSNLRK